MTDRISTYRQVRLVLQVPPSDGGRTYFSVHAVGHKRGVPSATILADGMVGPIASAPAMHEIVEALAAAVAQLQVT